jgi:hypothetical protein
MPVGLDLRDDETYPRYIKAVLGLDVRWKVKGRCHSRGKGAHRVWFLEGQHPGIGPESDRVTGNTLATIALGECSLCPVQWECVFYATQGEQDFGIWGIRSTDRKYLRRWFPSTWEREVERAKDTGEGVQEMMVRLRKGPRGVFMDEVA